MGRRPESVGAAGAQRGGSSAGAACAECVDSDAQRVELDCGRNPKDTPKLAEKRSEEAQMVSEMIALWCRGHHGGVTRDSDAPRVRVGLRTVTLCPECSELRDYALARIGRCPHMGTKTFCSVCPTHCYRAQMRERIRAVMRWAGPRMLLYKPGPAIRHAIVTVQAKRAACR